MQGGQSGVRFAPREEVVIRLSEPRVRVRVTRGGAPIAGAIVSRTVTRVVRETDRRSSSKSVTDKNGVAWLPAAQLAAGRRWFVHAPALGEHAIVLPATPALRTEPAQEWRLENRPTTGSLKVLVAATDQALVRAKLILRIREGRNDFGNTISYLIPLTVTGSANRVVGVQEGEYDYEVRLYTAHQKTPKKQQGRVSNTSIICALIQDFRMKPENEQLALLREYSR